MTCTFCDLKGNVRYDCFVNVNENEEPDFGMRIVKYHFVPELKSFNMFVTKTVLGMLPSELSGQRLRMHNSWRENNV